MGTPTRRIAAVAGLATMLLLAACSSNEETAQPAGQSDALAQSGPTDTPTPTPTSSPGVGGVELVGEGCGELPQSGPGSIADMATLPTASAVAGNPNLSDFSNDLDAAGLADQFDQATDVTVFAPVNDAYVNVPPEVLDELRADSEGELPQVLNYHAVSERLTPDAIDGEHPTLQGDSLSITTTDGQIMVNDAATVLCGNIPTANGVVYLIDEVLMP
jgi:uncharacterized surface protein with fasciclin (FAS1) repeats